MQKVSERAIRKVFFRDSKHFFVYIQQLDLLNRGSNRMFSTFQQFSRILNITAVTVLER